MTALSTLFRICHCLLLNIVMHFLAISILLWCLFICSFQIVIQADICEFIAKEQLIFLFDLPRMFARLDVEYFVLVRVLSQTPHVRAVV